MYQILGKVLDKGCRMLSFLKTNKPSIQTVSIAAFSLQKGGAKKEPKATLRSAALASPTPEKKRRGFISRVATRYKGFAPLTTDTF